MVNTGKAIHFKMEYNKVANFPRKVTHPQKRNEIFTKEARKDKKKTFLKIRGKDLPYIASFCKKVLKKQKEK